MKRQGTLYLLPMPLGDHWEGVLSGKALELLKSLDFFVTEYPRTARRFITQFRDVHPLTFEELNKRTQPTAIKPWIDKLAEGRDIGYLSEAGMPCIADPGRRLVTAAHAKGIHVVPVPGSSAILLALVASGLNGQAFTFHGYLSPKKSGREQELRDLAQTAKRTGQTQIFMETPYRNEPLLESALKVLPSQCRLTIAAQLTQPDEYVRTRTVGQWQKEKRKNLHKVPAVFCLGYR